MSKFRFNQFCWITLIENCNNQYYLSSLEVLQVTWEHFVKSAASGSRLIEATRDLCVKQTKIKCPNHGASGLIRHLSLVHGFYFQKSQTNEHQHFG